MKKEGQNEEKDTFYACHIVAFYYGLARSGSAMRTIRN